MSLGNMRIKGTPNTEEFVLGSNFSSPELFSGYKRNGISNYQTPRTDCPVINFERQISTNTASTDHTGGHLSPSNKFSHTFHAMV